MLKPGGFLDRLGRAGHPANGSDKPPDLNSWEDPWSRLNKKWEFQLLQVFLVPSGQFPSLKPGTKALLWGSGVGGFGLLGLHTACALPPAQLPQLGRKER